MAKRGYRRRPWEVLVARWRESGQSMRAYCQEHKLSYSQLVRWRRRLDPAATPRPLTLIPVLAAAARGSGLVVRLGDGLGIEVAPGFDAGVLVAVVQALQGSARC
ncbi:MAG: IS66 family insertion sequence element accessory protein TnpA [Gemmatimonadales bacterium]